MGYYSRKYLERIADKVVGAYSRLMEQREEPVFRIDPELLATLLLHLSVDRCHLSADGTVLGLTCPVELGVEVYDDQMKPFFYMLDGRTILVEKDLLEDAPLGRYQFTVMHEIAHQLLSRLEKRPGAAVYRHMAGPSSSTREWGEWQADTLAAALLMPPHLVRKALALVGLPDGIYILDELIYPQVYLRFRAAAALMQVSQTAFAIRLKQLGLLRHNDLFRPGSIVDIYREEDEVWTSQCAS